MYKKLAVLAGVVGVTVLIVAAVIAYDWLTTSESPEILSQEQGRDIVSGDDTTIQSVAPPADSAEPNEEPQDDNSNTEPDAPPEENADPTDPPEEIAEPTDPPEEVADPTPVDPPENPAPDFAFYDAEGNEVHLSDFLGSIVILNFWTTWCPGCVVESPVFQTLYDELGDEIYILKVNLQDNARGETRQRVEEFMEQNGYTFPMFFDEGAGVLAYAIRSIPATFFIDARGGIVDTHRGPVTEDVLMSGLEAAGFVR